MLVVNRFRVSDEGGFRPRLDAAIAAFAAQKGFLGADCGRNLDEPDLWVLVTTWANVGSYRRALSAYDVKVALAPVMEDLLHEASAFEEPDSPH